MSIGQFFRLKKNVHLIVRNVQLLYSHLFTGDNCALCIITAKEGNKIICSTYALCSVRDYGRAMTTPYYTGERIHL